MLQATTLTELQAVSPETALVKFLKDKRTARVLANTLIVGSVAFLALSVYATPGAAPSSSTAGTGDFSNIATTLKNWTEGSLGNVFALGTLAVGLGMGVVKQTIMPVVVAVGMAAAAKWGPGVLLGISSTLL